MQSSARKPDLESSGAQRLWRTADSGYVGSIVRETTYSGVGDDKKRISVIETDEEDFIETYKIYNLKHRAKCQVLNFVQCLSNIRNIVASLTTFDTVISFLSGPIILPEYFSSPNLDESESDAAEYFDIWGPDLPSEKRISSCLKKQPRCAAEYCMLRQQNFKEDPKLATKTVIGRLKCKWKAREISALNLLFSRTEDDDIIQSARELLNNTQMTIDDIADELTNLANGIADSKYNLVESELRTLLQNSAAIVRGRVEAQMVSEERPIGNPIAEGWFCVMMATWSQLRDFLMDDGNESVKFRSCVREKSVPVPGFFYW